MPSRRVKIDPELIRQLKGAELSMEPLEAVFQLRPSTLKGTTPSGVETLTHEILGRASTNAGISANDVNVFRNLGSFVVSARAPLIQALLNAPEIASVVANRRPPNESIKIPPFNTHPVEP
jgi:hypothetical protein